MTIFFTQQTHFCNLFVMAPPTADVWHRSLVEVELERTSLDYNCAPFLHVIGQFTDRISPCMIFCPTLISRPRLLWTLFRISGYC